MAYISQTSAGSQTETCLGQASLAAFLYSMPLYRAVSLDEVVKPTSFSHQWHEAELVLWPTAIQ